MAPAPVAYQPPIAPAPAPIPYPSYYPTVPAGPVLAPPPPPIPTPEAQAYAIRSAGSPIEDLLSIGSVGAVAYLAASAFGLL